MGKMRDTVTTAGTGTARAVPDVAVVRLGVEARAQSLPAAFEEASAAAQRTVDASLSAGTPRSDIASGGLWVRSETVWREGAGQKIIGYAAGAALTVTSRDLARTPELLGAVVRAAGDALRVNGLTLEVSDPSSARAAAQEAAFDDARAAAARLAARAGRTLGDVISISAGGPPAPGGPIPLARAALASSVEPMPVEAGEAEVSASVTVTWRLLPGPGSA
ncbi:SIMPL domain-containing protein [Sinomonas sp. JGH33]|uniref:SIMPL domain-containing protein n=1 Tax=Sinomonas terricola TaxID=3110330 RepID=A0ABU5T4L8_9MICC|nr:SIMPL domain-containing protein [Sinomonas sp. JGH33]MEA5454520.1 SIMPL domain-containing protein [Sinomonas sp. JGH33]